MVVIRRAGPSSLQKILRRVLEKGRYTTLDLKAEAGSEHSQESSLIRLIREGMISSEDYPLSPRTRRHRDQNDIASWENEGGSTAPTVKR